MSKPLPLVSVVVVTYNSSDTIFETLESIKNQTYNNLELIVSDDCSNDNTFEICKDWISQNKDYFIDCKLIKSLSNTGVAPNLNRGVNSSNGEWVKIIAGDDTLVVDSICKFVDFVSTQKCEFCVSDLNLFSNDEIDLSSLRLTYDFYYSTIKESYKRQLNRIYREYTIPGPGFFFSRELYNNVGGFNEKYPMGEEWPFVYKVLKCGYKVYASPGKLVNYRVSASSLCRGRNQNKMINYKFYLSLRNFYFDCLHKDLLKQGAVFTAFENYIHYHICDAIYKHPDKNSRYYKLLYLLSPKHYFIVIKQIFNSNKLHYR